MSHKTNWQNSRRWFGTAVITLGILLFIVILNPTNAANKTPDIVIHLQTADIILQPGIYDVGHERYGVLKFGRVLLKAEIDALAADGIRLQSYLGDDTFIAGIDTQRLTEDVQKKYDILADAPWLAANKATPALRQHVVPEWARTSDGLLKLSVLFFNDVTRSEMENILNRYDHSNKKEISPGTWSIEIDSSQLDALLHEQGIHYVESGPIPFQPVLDEVRPLIHANEVQQASYTNNPPEIWYAGLTGKDVNLQVSEAVWDDHPDFINADGTTRFLNPSPGIGSYHGTHVAGIIGGDGVLSASLQDTPYYANTGHWRGIAPEANLFDNFYGGDQGHLIDASNHSYVMEYGEYGNTSESVDSQVRGDEGFNLKWPRIWAAANQGMVPKWGNDIGYYSLYAPAKNSLAVGSVNANDAILSPFSSLGPTFDGRIKPDVMAPGGTNYFPRDLDVQTDRMQITFDFIRIINARTGSIDASWEFNQDGNAEGWFESGNFYNIFNVTVSDGYLTFDVGFAPDGSGNELPWGWNESVNLQTDPDHEIVIKYKMNFPSDDSSAAGSFIFHQQGDYSNTSGNIRFRSIANDNWIVEAVKVGRWGLSNNKNYDGWSGTIDKLGMIPFANNWPETTSTFYDGLTQTYAYNPSQGTSMAAPAVTGSVGLILQQFRDQHGLDLASNPPLPSTIKAILVQTAEDLVHATADPRDRNNPDTNSPVLYYAGPDFATGYGLINVKAAVDLVEADPGPGARTRFMHEKELDSHQKHVFEMYVTEDELNNLSGELKFTLAWDDRPGEPSTNQTMPKLVNDLDLYLVDPDGVVHFPWTLDPLPIADCGEDPPGCGTPDPIRPADVVPARKAADRRNNVEMVQVNTAVSGNWFVVVDAYHVPWPNQSYSLVGNHMTQAPHHQSATTLVSLDSEGNQSNSFSFAASISDNGRYVAFQSYADNLVDNDTNDSLDIFVRDRQYGQTSRISVSSAGEQSNSVSYIPAISANGRYVVFLSDANNLVPNDTNNAMDFFVHDLQTGQTERVSVNSAGEQTNGNEFDITRPAISADGRFVAFLSTAYDLVPGDSNNVRDVFVHDRQTGETTRVSVNSQGNQSNGPAGYEVAISSNGRYVAYGSEASNLVNNDSNNEIDIFVHDRQTGETTRVSVSSQGDQSNGLSGYHIAISGDGRYVAFESDASNLVNEDSNDATDVFVHDRHNGQTRRVSIDSAGNQSPEGGSTSALSADGRYAAFKTYSALVPTDTDDTVDIYIHDLLTGQTTQIPTISVGLYPLGLVPVLSGNGRYVAYDTSGENPLYNDANSQHDIFVYDRGVIDSLTTRISIDSFENQGNDWSGQPAISDDGRFVAFGSKATNLVKAPANGLNNIYIRDQQTGQTQRVSADFAGDMANGWSSHPAISATGRYVAYSSEASNLVYGDTNEASDVFLFDSHTGQTSRISVNALGAQSNGSAYEPSISENGRYIAYDAYADNLTPNDGNNSTDIFVHDRDTGEVFNVSVSSSGEQGNNGSFGATISDDGNIVAFRSYATNLVTNDSNGSDDVFVHDRQTGMTTRVSVDSAGNESNSGTLYYGNPVTSGDGRYVVFNSDASNLVANDTNNNTDIFVHDRNSGQTSRVSVDSAGNQANGYSGYSYSISPDGRYIAFESDASNLVDNDSNDTTDVFIHDQQTGRTTRVASDLGGGESYAYSGDPVLSADGQYVAFISDAVNMVSDDTNGRSDIFVQELIHKMPVTYLPIITTNP